MWSRKNLIVLVSAIAGPVFGQAVSDNSAPVIVVEKDAVRIADTPPAAPSDYAETWFDGMESLTIDQVILQVVGNNDRAAAARFMQEAAERRVSAEGVWDDPMLMLGAQNVPTNFDFEMDPMTMRMIGLSQNIPYSGYKGLEKKAARAEARAAFQERRETEIDLVAAAKSAFFEVYFLRQNMVELKRQHEILEQVFATSTAKLRVNQAGQDEVLGAQADIWRLEIAILSTEQEITSAVNRLNSLRGAEPEAPLPSLVAPPMPSLPASADNWIAVAERIYPPLLRLNEKAEGYEFSARSSRRMAWPMLELGASYGFRSGVNIGAGGMSENRDDMVNFQATISLPIFSIGKQRSMARSMEWMGRSAESEFAQLRRDTRAELLTLYQRARRLSQTLDSYRDRIIPATEDAFRSALAGYAANRTTFALLSSFGLALYRDRLTSNQVAYDLARTFVEIERFAEGTTRWDRETEDFEQEK